MFQTVELTYKTTTGALSQQIVYRKDEEQVAGAQAGGEPLEPTRPGSIWWRRRSGSR